MLFQVSKTHPLKDKIIADFKQNLEFLGILSSGILV